MSSGCGDVLSLADLQTAKKHQLFEAEVITGKTGGIASGADIDYATNQATGQTQKTMPAILRDIGFIPVAWDFSTGGTLGVNDRDKVVYDPVSKTWYSYAGTLPITVPAGFNPVGNADWKPQTDPNLREDLASYTSGKGAQMVAGVAVESLPSSASTSITGSGRYAIGRNSGGSDLLYQVSDSTTYAADGTIVISRPDGKKMVLSVEDMIDVRIFADGVRTDQQVLQAALDYAGSVTGFMGVKVTPKNLNGDPWVFTGLHIGPKTILCGAGGWLKFADNICVNASTAYYLVENFNSDDVHITDLYIDGNQANNALFSVADVLTFGGNRCSLNNVSLVNAPDSGLMFATTKNCWVNGLYVENTRDLGIYLSASVAGGTRNCAMSNLVLRDCAQGAMGFKRYVADIVVDNVAATNCGNGITFEGFEVVTPGMNPSNITMSNIRLRDIGYGYRSVSAAERALSFDYARGIRINNLSVQNCSGVGIFFSANTSTGIYINGANLTGYAASPQIASGVPNNDGIQCNGASGFELVNVNLEGFARYAAWFLNCSAGSVIGGRWTNSQASGYSTYNGARVNASCSFTKFSPEFISGISGTDLEWFNGATGITKDTILNNATGPAKYGYVVVSGATPVATVIPRFIGQEVWSSGASSWWKSHGLTSSDWKQMSN